ncbi:MAG: autotransporter domain-containing protein [Alphaproteobacteria bacterium]|nr:autotransporter domain-containing protein [Alphaproteobacteria bacterium]
MKNKLLLTTALVAFSMPAMAELGSGDWKPTADEVKALTSVSDYDVHTGSAETGSYGSNYTLIWVKGVQAETAQGAVFKNNIADNGGVFAIGGEPSSLKVNGATFDSNTSYAAGGAISNYGGLSISNSTFKNNQSGLIKDKTLGGGAIALGAVSSTDIASITNTLFENNTSYMDGGAIGTRHSSVANNSAAELNIEATFTGNKAHNNGGAIYNTFYAGTKGVTVKGDFTSNTAGKSGGAIYNDGAKDLAGNNGGVMTISDSTFTGNKAGEKGHGGAILDSGTLTVSNTTFKNNEAYVSGAIGQANNATGSMTIENSIFEENYATADAGALGIYKSAIVKNTQFIGNTAGLDTPTYKGASDSDGGGAVMIGGTANATLEGVTFKDNESAVRGGAISARHGVGYTLKITKDSLFEGNKSGNFGGAIANVFGGTVEISDATFDQNEALKAGGAIYNGKDANFGGAITSTTSSNHGIIKLSGTNVFSNNSADEGGAIYNDQGGQVILSGSNTFSQNGASDIYNRGSLTVSGSLALDGGIAGEGTVVFEEGSKVSVMADQTKIENTVKNNGATLSMIFNTGFTGKYQLITGSLDNEFKIAENSLYDISLTDVNGTYTITKKSANDIASNLGLSSGEAQALTAATSGSSSSNAFFNEAIRSLNEAAQTGDSSIAKETSKLGTDTNPVVSSQETSMQDVLFNAVSTELNGGAGAIAEGKSSGDYFKKATAWVRGLFNKADHEATSKSAGFNSDTYGVAMGVDSEVDTNTRLGLGYANAQTDIKTEGRDTDVDTNSLFVYAKYKPADWYVNTMLAYSWSEYDEKKSVMGVNASSNYDVETIALQSMYGYETKFKEYDLTPELGFRYMHIDQDTYTDKLGTTVASNQEDVLTLVAGAKIAKNYTSCGGTIWRPELKAAVTYDLFDANNSANVLLANGAGYTVNGEKLDRLGFELGAKVSANATEEVELTAGYLARLRNDYQDHTLTFEVKYNF